MSNTKNGVVECANSTIDNRTKKRNLLQGYVDDIVCKVKDDLDNLRQQGKSLQKKNGIHNEKDG